VPNNDKLLPVCWTDLRSCPSMQLSQLPGEVMLAVQTAFKLPSQLVVTGGILRFAGLQIEHDQMALSSLSKFVLG